MNKIIKKISVVFMISVLFLSTFPITAKAESTASISVGSATSAEGDEVEVSIKVTGTAKILLTELNITYDASVLGFVEGSDCNGGGGLLRMLNTDTYTSKTFTVKFKALKPGTSAVSVQSIMIGTETEDNIPATISNGSVKVNAPVTASGNNNLSSLQISPGTLSPNFSPNVTSYTATVGADCAKLIVSAVTEDSNATIKTAGTRMDPGSNTTTVTVTAKNGTTKVYTIRTTKEAAQSTEGATEKPTEGQTENPTSPAQSKDPEAVVDNVKYKIISDFSAHPLPDGYIAEEFEYNTYKVMIGKNSSNNLSIMYLEKMDGSGEGGFYVFDTVKKTFTKLVTVSHSESSYTILAIDNSMELPDGFVKSKATIDGNNVDVLTPSGAVSSEFYLFYGVSAKGKATWYCYDTVEKTVQRYLTVVHSATDANVQAKDTNNNSNLFIWKITSIAAGAIAVLFMIFTTVLVVKRRSSSNMEHAPEDNFFIVGDILDEDEGEYEEDEYEEDEYEEDEDDNKDNGFSWSDDSSQTDDISLEDVQQENDLSKTVNNILYDKDDADQKENKNILEEENDFEFLEIEDIDEDK